ncbi:hypothetical protein [Bacillus salacetis]|nr:hypothetical protein [Bacillus salacetis]
MDNKPLHYDGSINSENGMEEAGQPEETFILTPEARKNISGNPFGVKGED